MSASVPNPALLLAQPPRCPTKQRDRGQSKRPGNTQKPTRPHSREQRLSEVTPRFPKPWPGAVGVAWGVAAALRQSAPGKSQKKKKAGPRPCGWHRFSNREDSGDGASEYQEADAVTGMEEADDRRGHVPAITSGNPHRKRNSHAAQPDGKAAFLCGKNAAKRPRPRRGARRENRELLPAFRKCFVPLSVLSPALCRKKGGVRSGANAGHVLSLRKEPEGRASRGRGDRVTSGRKLRPLRIIRDGDHSGHQD